MYCFWTFFFHISTCPISLLASSVLGSLMGLSKPARPILKPSKPSSEPLTVRTGALAQHNRSGHSYSILICWRFKIRDHCSNVRGFFTNTQSRFSFVSWGRGWGPLKGAIVRSKSPTRVRDQNVKVPRGNGREQYSDRSRVVDSTSRPTDDFSIQKETEKNWVSGETWHRLWPPSGSSPTQWFWPRSHRQCSPICSVPPGCVPVTGEKYCSPNCTLEFLTTFHISGVGEIPEMLLMLKSLKI